LTKNCHRGRCLTESPAAARLPQQVVGSGIACCHADQDGIVSIHSEHPFLEPEAERDAARRLRGRLGGTVTLWTCGAGASRAGLTVSSLMVAGGEPAHVLGLLDPDSHFVDVFQTVGKCVVQLLQWPHRDIAEAFASVAPAPGGVFRLAEWQDTEWGPRLQDAASWAALRLVEARNVGWSLLVDSEVEHVVLGEGPDPLVHRRGRYLPPA
jgi:flavin reductase (DIM6/NTAB) family NADH-FMN oxidoreductase RutF